MLSLQGASDVLGVSVPMVQFLVGFIATLPLGWGWRLLPRTSPRARHWYAAISGALVSHYALPSGSNLLLLVPIVVSFASMLLWRRRCGAVTFVIAFGFLLACHVHFMSGESWKRGGIDATGALMVLTLKVISAAMNYQYGMQAQVESMRPAQKKYRIVDLPSPIAYLGYCLNCGTHLVGPVYELRDYIEWTENKSTWSGDDSPLYLVPSLQALGKSFLCMAFFMLLSPHFTIGPSFRKSIDQPWSAWKTFQFLWMCGFTSRWKYYFIWSISEASLILSGGVFQLLATQVVAAVWHGLYIGYLLFFVHSALMIAGARIIYKWQLWMNSTPHRIVFIRVFGTSWEVAVSRSYGIPVVVKEGVGWAIGFSYSSFVLHYAWAGFLLLDYTETLSTYHSMYFIGTIVPLVVLLFGKAVKPPQAVRREEMDTHNN